MEKSIKDIFDPWWEKLVEGVHNNKSITESIEFDGFILEYSFRFIDNYECSFINELGVVLAKGAIWSNSRKCWVRNGHWKQQIPNAQLKSLKASIEKELNKKGYTI